MRTNIVLIFILHTFFVGCSDSSNSIEVTIEPNPEQRYIHMNSNFGDVHPAYFNGELYMYYLNTDGNYQSDLSKSKDNFTFQDFRLNTDTEARPYSVLYVFEDPKQKRYISYHSTDGVVGNGILRGSVSTDLLNWKQMSNKYTVPEPKKPYKALKDPFVFWNDDTKSYWAVRTGRENDNVAWEFLYYTSNDLTNWEDKGTLYLTDDVYGPIECPQMFKFGEYWYLLYSEYLDRVGKPQYFVSKNPEGPYNLPDASNWLDGSDNCAAQVVDINGELLLYGWIPFADVETIGYQGWGGPLALPRKLSQNADGVLFTSLPSSVSSAIRAEKLKTLVSELNLSSRGSDVTTETILVDERRFDLNFNISSTINAESFGIILSTTEKEKQIETIIEISNEQLIIKTGNIIHSSLKLALETGEHNIRIISDKDIIECFINNQYSLSAMVSRNIDKTDIKAYLKNGNIKISNIEVFQLKNLSSSNM